jgi:cysteine desulfuration protein SufE
MSDALPNPNPYPLTPSQEHVINSFKEITDPQEKYKKIIELGLQAPPLPQDQRTESNLVSGCQSTVYLSAIESSDGKLYFSAYSEALISAGLAWIATQFYSGLRPEQILQTSPIFIEHLQLTQSLTPGRSNGLISMIDLIKKKSIQIYMGTHAIVDR